MRDGQNVTLAAVATAAGLERRRLLRRFANATGMTPIGYCRAVRIARARELLEGGELSEKEIAAPAGYRNVTSFAPVFRSCGLGPGVYRESFRRNDISPSDSVAKDNLRQKKPVLEAVRQADCGGKPIALKAGWPITPRHI
jgi:AraC-like DNA-binding protein